ncbi:hypothetical protein Gxy13693_046_010 [Komagataeibacter xylinus NBRC 13693]|uniref:Uncharacterized protein n=1 Tax=Komagataeibacter xylinus NBRC 13693 TaxID=1234668 RepID=A0A0D6QAM2_KOMXY|nr:hypothetical protein Gxy13693_046_010 [Komagataeibacter xylinus NBRC 13693]
MKIGKTCGLSAMTHGYPLKGHDKRPTWTKHRLAEKARHRNDQRGWTALPWKIREFSLIETVNALRGDLTVRTHGTSLSQTGFNLHPTVQRSDTTNDERRAMAETG